MPETSVRPEQVGLYEPPSGGPPPASWMDVAHRRVVFVAGCASLIGGAMALMGLRIASPAQDVADVKAHDVKQDELIQLLLKKSDDFGGKLQFVTYLQCTQMQAKDPQAQAKCAPIMQAYRELQGAP